MDKNSTRRKAPKRARKTVTRSISFSESVYKAVEAARATENRKRANYVNYHLGKLLGVAAE